MRRQAFTLIEILVVVAIMLLLVAAILPTVKYALDESKVREGSRQLNSYLAMAKTRAASTGRPCGVYFDTDQTTGICSQLYMAEVPPSYMGDFTESHVIVTDSSGVNWGRIHAGTTTATSMAGPPWTLNFVPVGSAGGLLTLLNPGEFFSIQIGDSQIKWEGYRGNAQDFYLTGLKDSPTPPLKYPATATSDYTDASGIFHPDPGYAYKIIRSPKRIGQPLALPRGTAIDSNYSGLGNTGTEFSKLPVTVLFAPDGHVINTSQTLHFLVGRPEKVINQPFAPDSNIVDNAALWVSVATLTGSVSTTENAANVALPRSTPAEQTAFLIDARKFASEQDVKGN